MTGTDALGIAAHARVRPNRDAIVFGDRRLTYAELDARANQVARAMEHAGVAAGDRVALALRNRPEFFEASSGAARAGAEVVTVGARLTAGEAGYLIDDSGAKLIVAEADVDLPEGLEVWRLGADYEQRLAGEAAAGTDEPSPVRFRFYTSGTTGRPKAIERPRAPADAYLASVQSFPPLAGLTHPDEVHLICGPLYHTAPCAFAQYALLFGHTIVLMPRFDAANALALVERESITWSHMVPINFVRILQLGEAALTAFNPSSIKKILHAAAPCPPDVKRRIMEFFPLGVVWEYYGMTEGFATIISPEEWLKKPGSVGRAAPGVAVKILDDAGREMKPGETGLVYVAPANATRFAYAGAPEKTAEAWRGDLFTVGDMGYLDTDGYLFLTDRKQDMIITGGANVYPAEVEATLHGHPAVGDVAVIGVPDDEWGEVVKAIVEPRVPVTETELIQFCRDHLAHYKCPRTVDLVETLARDENGKVRKRELRERYWAGRPTRI